LATASWLAQHYVGFVGDSPPVEQLGHVVVPSGDLLLIDFGLLHLWSGDSPPLLREGDAPAEVIRAANTAQDWEIVGADAAEVAAALDLAVVKGRYAFDIPADSDLVHRRVDSVISGTRMSAEVQRLGRVPHRQRILRLLDDCPDGVEVPFHGPWAVAARGLPVDRPMRVLGTRMDPDGPDAGRWHNVWVEVNDADPVLTTHIGHVLVDEARLMFVDARAVQEWRSGHPTDGLADVALWGRDAADLAGRFGAAPLPGEEGCFGWTDLLVAAAETRAVELQRLRESGTARFAFDFRPHDDHYRLLAQARATPTGSGSLECGGAQVTGFFTAWGDGAFPVFRDSDAGGKLCRIRVELGAPEIVARTRRFDDLWFGELSKMALVSTDVGPVGGAVGWLYREAPERDQDSGWRVFSGQETQDFLDDPANVSLVPLRELVVREPALEALLRAPHPTAFERDGSGTFVQCAFPGDG
jgi:hypothetical protein